MTTTEILDKIAPYTQSDKRCGFNRKRKTELRYKLMIRIEEMTAAHMTKEAIYLSLKHESSAAGRPLA